jgi:hypothetical protein
MRAMGQSLEDIFLQLTAAEKKPEKKEEAPSLAEEGAAQ